MRRTDLSFLILILTSNGFFASLFAEEGTTRSFLYQETTGSQVDTCTCIIEKTSDGYVFTVNYSDEVYQFKTNPDYLVENCKISKTKSNNTLNVERQGNTLLLNDNNGSDTIKVGDQPWYQTSFSLAGFAQSADKKQEFYQATTHDEEGKKQKVSGSAMKMVAKKENIEILKIDGQNIETVKTTITLPGFKSMFWKITYWYRLSDGAVVQYEDVRGGPGTPKTFGMLMREEMN